METRYLIVGGSAAGMAAAHTIRKNDGTGEILVLSGESCAPYFRPMIPYVVTGRKTPHTILLDGNGMFTADRVEVKTGSIVESVDTSAKSVTTSTGQVYAYDKLLLATGSRPYMPESVNGLDNPGVFSLKTLEDAVKIAQRCDQCNHAVMLGGGILNLKTAFALLEKKIRVTLVVYSPQILSQLMDPDDAYLVRQALDDAGLDVITGCSATQIIAGDNGVKGVALDNGRELSCEMVCVGKGVLPNTDFLDNTGIDVDKGIIADAYTACTAPDIYTAGDAAVTFDPGTGEKTVTALWTNAVEMGICAGRNMAGVKTRYAGTLGIMNATQVAGLPFVSMGLVHTNNKNVEVFVSKTKDTYRKIVLNPEGNRLLGALFIGNIKNAGLYRYAIREQKPVEKIKKHLINQTIHYGHFT